MICRCCCYASTLAGLISLLASISFFAVTWILAYDLVERNIAFFTLAVFYSVETISFSAYFFGLARLRFVSLRWTIHRIVVPLLDFTLSVVTAFIGSWLLPCGMILDFYNQFYLLNSLQLFSVIVIIVCLILKLVTAIVLTRFHVKLAFSLNRENDIPLFYPPPSAPLSVEMTSASQQRILCHNCGADPNY